MTLETAKMAARLSDRRDDLVGFIITAKNLWADSSVGKTTITISRAWLPFLIEKAEAELREINDKIEKL